MNKGGQFFLIAALVIVGVIATLITVYNNANSTEEENSVYDLSKEINYEGAQIIDSGTFQAKSQSEIESNIERLTDYYAQNVTPIGSLLIIYGNSSDASYILYNRTDIGTINVMTGSGGTTTTIIQMQRETKGTLDTSGSSNVGVILAPGITQTFQLKHGQNFFIILQKERDTEVFISTPAGGRSS